MKNWKKLAEKMLKNMDRQKWIVCILIGVLLLVIAIPVDSKKQDAGTQESVQTTETESSSYVEQMERELEDLLGQMDGVGAVRVRGRMSWHRTSAASHPRPKRGRRPRKR